MLAVVVYNLRLTEIAATVHGAFNIPSRQYHELCGSQP